MKSIAIILNQTLRENDIWQCQLEIAGIFNLLCFERL